MKALALVALLAVPGDAGVGPPIPEGFDYACDVSLCTIKRESLQQLLRDKRPRCWTLT